MCGVPTIFIVDGTRSVPTTFKKTKLGVDGTRSVPTTFKRGI